MNKDLRIACDVLDKVFRDNAYSNILLTEVLDKTDNRALVTRIVYGVLEKNITLEYYIGQLVKNKPQKKVMTVLKIGVFLIKFMDSMPDYAIVNEMVDLCGYLKKNDCKGFVNATLKRCLVENFQLPEDEKEKLSVEYSVPLWLIKAYFKQYGRDKTLNIISEKTSTLEHIRVNKRLFTDDDVKEYFKSNDITFMPSNYGGYYVKNTKLIQELFAEGKITFQSPSSMLAVKALDIKDNSTILDMCASPGGKSVFISEHGDNLKITACDLYPHRVELIKNYAERMKSNGIKCIVADGTVTNKKWLGKYDYTLCDAPCSGLGVAHKKPDFYLKKSYDDILNLAEIQYALLNNAVNYTKKGGVIVYSTCTTLREENYNIIGKTLKMRKDVKLEKISNIDIENEGFVQILPMSGMDGFFIARLRKC